MICIPSTWFSSHTTSQQHFSSYKHQSRLRSRVHVCPSWPQKFPSRRHALPGAPPSLLQDGPLPRKPRRGRPAVAFARCLRPSELPRLRGAGRRAAPRGLPERRQLGLWRRHVRVWRPRRPWGPPHSQLLGLWEWRILGPKFCCFFCSVDIRGLSGEDAGKDDLIQNCQRDWAEAELELIWDRDRRHSALEDFFLPIAKYHWDSIWIPIF